MALCRIDIDGQNVTSAVAPFLLSLRVSDRAGKTSATCEIELSDVDGRVLMPRRGAKMTVALGQSALDLAVVFTGKVDETRSHGSSEGRKLTVSAKEIDASGKAKQPQSKHFDDRSVKDVLTEAGKEAGVTEIRVDEALGSVRLPYAVMQNESFLDFGLRLASEFGATFKVTDGRATFTARNGGGMPFPTVVAAWGENLLEWDVSPALGRPRFKKARARWHDPKTGKTKETDVELDFEDTEAETTETFAAPDEDAAKRKAGSTKAEVERNAGGGSVTILGSVTAQPEGKVQIVGARPGVDGVYAIEAVDHDYSRNGFVTRCEIKRPGKGVGEDARAAS